MRNIYTHQTGFSLIEIMIAVVVLSVGLLGLAGMQFGGLRSVSDSTTYTKASMAVAEMAERLHSNPVAVANNAFASVSSDAGAGATTTINCAAVPNPYCSSYYDTATPATVAAASCSPDELAAFDINTWFCGEITIADGSNRTNSLANSLNNVTAAITCAAPCSIGSVHEITLAWDERTQQEGGATVRRTIGLTVQP